MFNFSSSRLNDQTLATQKLASVIDTNHLRNVSYESLHLHEIKVAKTKYLCLNIQSELNFSETQLLYLAREQSKLSNYFNWQFLPFRRISKQMCIAEISNLAQLSTYNFNYQHRFSIQLLCELLGICLDIVKANAEQWYLANYIIFKSEHIYYSPQTKTWFFTLLPLTFTDKKALIINTNHNQMPFAATTKSWQATTDFHLSYQKQVQTNLDNMIFMCLKKLDNLLRAEQQPSKFRNLFKGVQKAADIPNLLKIYEYINSENWPDLIPYLAKFKTQIS